MEIDEDDPMHNELGPDDNEEQDDEQEIGDNEQEHENLMACMTCMMKGLSCQIYRVGFLCFHENPS
jgi:hypothetical protein